MKSAKPYVIVNMAASIDGKISDERRRQLCISCSEDLARVDRLRAESDAIMVGIGTIIADDPRLTVKSEELRKWRLAQGKPENPMRVVVDSRCRIPQNAKVLNGEARTIIAVSKLADGRRIAEVSRRAEVVVCGERKVDLVSLMKELYRRDVRKLMVEGGGTLVSSLLRSSLVDEMYIYFAPIFIGGAESPTLCDGSSFDPPLKAKLVALERLGEGILVRLSFKVQES